MMRLKTIALLGVGLALAGCRGGNKPDNKVLDKNAMVYINVKDGKATRAVNPDLPDNPAHLTPHQLVEQAENMLMDNNKYKDMRFWLGGILDENDWLVRNNKRKIGEYQYKDIQNAKFILWGDFVIRKDREGNTVLEDEFFTFDNVRFVDKDEKIIGYIPQRIFREAWKQIKTAFDAGDYDKVYKLFRETYTAFPCTPEEYEKLKADGKN